MKFICDVHLAYKLVNYLKRRGCECHHVNTIFADPRASDQDIAKHADSNDLIVVTKDEDFKDSYILKRTPKKLVKLNTGNSSTQQMIDLLKTIGRFLWQRINDRISLSSLIFTIFILSKSTSKQ